MEISSEKTLGPGPQLGSMFSCPSATLSCLKEQPRWFHPLLLAATFSAAVNFYVIHQVGFLRLISAALQVSAAIDPRASVDNALAHKSQIIFFHGLSTFAGTFLTAFVVAKVLWLILEVIGEDLPFKRVMAVVAHVTMLMVVIRESMLALTVTVMPNLENLDLRNPLATNLAFFFHPSSPAAFRLLASLDVVTFANILLLALGLSRVSNRLSFHAACILVIVPWAVYVGASLLLPAMS